MLLASHLLVYAGRVYIATCGQSMSMTGPLVLHCELVADRVVPDGHDRHDPHPQSSPRHHALQPSADRRGEGGGARGNWVEGGIHIDPIVVGGWGCTHTLVADGETVRFLELRRMHFRIGGAPHS